MSRNKLLAGVTVAVFVAASAPFAIAQIAPPDQVETAQLPTDAFAIGALSPAEGALPSTLWDGSDPQTLEFLMTHAPSRPVSPSVGIAMRRILLSPGSKPLGAGPSLGGKKLLALARAGFVNEAQTVASLATAGKSDLAVAEAEATINLLNGETQAACRRGSSLTAGRESIFWVKLRAFCYGQAGEFDAFDLTMNLLREQGQLTPADETLLLATVTKSAPKGTPDIQTALHLAAARAAGLPINRENIASADGGVVNSLMSDAKQDMALRIDAAEQALAMGAASVSDLTKLMNGASFEVAEVAAARDLAAARPNDPLADALLYQSVGAMTAPEFVRDKAQRISLALGRADSFHRAYALALLYSDELEALDGVLVAPSEAANFARARMAMGDSVGAGHWLTAMVGADQSVGALPEDLAGEFIDAVNLLALLDPQTASRIARGAGVSVLSEPAIADHSSGFNDDPAVTARILEAAFDAVAGEKMGQAGLAAIASSSNDNAVTAVIVSEGLDAAGMPELDRRHKFERAWAATFWNGAATSDAGVTATPVSATGAPGDNALKPRLKPGRGE